MSKSVVVCLALILLLAFQAIPALADCNHEYSFSWGYTYCKANLNDARYCDLIVVKVYKCQHCKGTMDELAQQTSKHHMRYASGCNF